MLLLRAVIKKSVNGEKNCAIRNNFLFVSIPKKFIWKWQEHLLQLVDLENKEKDF
jgi:hypothetical protein